MSAEEALALVPFLIKAGRAIFEAFSAASQGDGEEAHRQIRLANDALELAIARRELK